MQTCEVFLSLTFENLSPINRFMKVCRGFGKESLLTLLSGALLASRFFLSIKPNYCLFNPSFFFDQIGSCDLFSDFCRLLCQESRPMFKLPIG